MDKLDRIDEFRNFVIRECAPIDDAMIHLLDKYGYFEAPASKGHHLAEPGGLCVHSMGVTKRLIEMTDKLGLTWQRDCSPMIVGLFHDLCKMDAYIPVVSYTLETRTLDGAVVSESEKYIDHYEWNNYQLLSGHGDKSVMLASQFMKLTEEEVACIRYHMGAFSDDSKERTAYSNAIIAYPNVLFVHTADMWSSQIDKC